MGLGCVRVGRSCWYIKPNSIIARQSSLDHTHCCGDVRFALLFSGTRKYPRGGSRRPRRKPPHAPLPFLFLLKRSLSLFPFPPSPRPPSINTEQLPILASGVGQAKDPRRGSGSGSGSGRPRHRRRRRRHSRDHPCEGSVCGDFPAAVDSRGRTNSISSSSSSRASGDERVNRTTTPPA